jgi:hypothetical protein
MGTKITIRHRFTDAVLFECAVPDEYSGMAMRYALEKATESSANLSSANLSGADLRSANLRSADLSYADLSSANLSYANLRGANLRGANIDDKEITIPPLSLSGLLWSVLITDGYLRIGCQRHTHAEWDEFSDEQISEMGPRAHEFWSAWKGPLLAMCAAHAAGVVVKTEAVEA